MQQNQQQMQQGIVQGSTITKLETYNDKGQPVSITRQEFTQHAAGVMQQTPNVQQPGMAYGQPQYQGTQPMPYGYGQPIMQQQPVMPQQYSGVMPQMGIAPQYAQQPGMPYYGHPQPGTSYGQPHMQANYEQSQVPVSGIGGQPMQYNQPQAQQKPLDPDDALRQKLQRIRNIREKDGEWKKQAEIKRGWEQKGEEARKTWKGGANEGLLNAIRDGDEQYARQILASTTINVDAAGRKWSRPALVAAMDYRNDNHARNRLAIARVLLLEHYADVKEEDGVGYNSFYLSQHGKISNEEVAKEQLDLSIAFLMLGASVMHMTTDQNNNNPDKTLGERHPDWEWSLRTDQFDKFLAVVSFAEDFDVSLLTKDVLDRTSVNGITYREMVTKAANAPKLDMTITI